MGKRTRTVVQIWREEDHPIIAAGLRTILATTGIEVLPATGAPTRDADVVVLICNGVRADLEEEVRELARLSVGVVVLDCDGAYHAAVPSLASGALSYIRLDHPESEIVQAIDAAARRTRYITSEVANVLVAALDSDRTESRQPEDLLTPREYEVMIELGRGATTKQVARHLGVSNKTVNAHRAAILGKLRLRTNAELVRYCVARGLC